MNVDFDEKFFLMKVVLMNLHFTTITLSRFRNVDRYTCRTPHFHMDSHCTIQTTCVSWFKGLKGSRRIVCQKHSLIHASYFTLRLTAHLTPAQVLSHQPLLCYYRPLLRTQICCRRIRLSTAKIRGRMVLLRNSTSPQVMNPRESSSTRIWSNHKSNIDDQDDVKEIGVKPQSLCQSLTHSDYDSAESIATPPDSDVADEQLGKMLASPLYVREREEMKDNHELITQNEKA